MCANLSYVACGEAVFFIGKTSQCVYTQREKSGKFRGFIVRALSKKICGHMCVCFLDVCEHHAIVSRKTSDASRTFREKRAIELTKLLNDDGW